MIKAETRRNIFDQLELEGYYWSGRMSDIDFLARLFDLKSLPSHDGRFGDAAGDIWQHTENNYDYQGYWVVGDDRFNLLHCDDEIFLRFLSEMVHPLVRPDSDDVAKMVALMNDWLAEAGWELTERTRVGGKPIYIASLSGAHSATALDRAK